MWPAQIGRWWARLPHVPGPLRQGILGANPLPACESLLQPRCLASNAAQASPLRGSGLPGAAQKRLQAIAERCAVLERAIMGQSEPPAGQRHDRQEQSAAAQENLQDIQREYARLAHTADLWKQFCRVRKEIPEVDALTNDKDKDLAAEARAEKQRLLTTVANLEEQLLLGLLPRQEEDESRSAIVEVRPGTGGAEASLFASELIDMYTGWARNKGWACEPLEVSQSEAGGVRSANIGVSGDGAYKQLRWEAGVHRVQRVPVTETQGRIHTSTAAVVVLPEATEVEMVLRDSDLIVEAFRASGPGGQHVNTTSSAVRVTHKPSGLTVACQDERSQMRNRAKAVRLLRARLLQMEREKAVQSETAQRRAQVTSADRHARIRTYQIPQDRVTDHRVGLSFSNVPAIMSGCESDALDRIHDALTQEEQREMLEELLSETE